MVVYRSLSRSTFVEVWYVRACEEIYILINVAAVHHCTGHVGQRTYVSRLQCLIFC